MQSCTSETQLTEMLGSEEGICSTDEFGTATICAAGSALAFTRKRIHEVLHNCATVQAFNWHCYSEGTAFHVWRMPSSGMWRRVDPVKWTDVSEERIYCCFFTGSSVCCYLLTPVPPSWIFLPEVGDDTFLRNVGLFHRIYTAPHPRRRCSS
jgi:hypothetical protein